MVINKTQAQIIDLYHQYFRLRDSNSLDYIVFRNKYDSWATTNKPRYDTATTQRDKIRAQYLITNGDKFETIEYEVDGNKKERLKIQDGKTYEEYEKAMTEVGEKIVAVEI